MRSSSILTLVGATLAVASPLHFKLHKKAVVWDIVTDIVYVTVTEGQLPKSHPETTVTVKHTHFVNPIPATTSEKVVPTTPPPPPPPSTPPPPPPPATTEAPAPAPTTQEAAKAVVPTVAPVVQAPPPVVQAAAPVVQAAAPAAAVSDSVPNDYKSAALEYHNALRANHGANALTWSDKLASAAQKLSDTCHFGHNMGIDGGGYGQNIGTMGIKGDGQDKIAPTWNHARIVGQSIVNDWYGPEQANFASNHAYGQSNPDVMGMNAAHFTQVVWKDTTTLGCGVTYCPLSVLPGNYGYYVVCNYGSPGNFAGEYAQNVGEKTGDAPKVKAPWS